MPSTYFEDSTTVMGDTFPSHSPNDLHKPNKAADYTQPGNGSGIGAREVGTAKLDEFINAPDYMETDRPFFVRIGQGGLLAALQELNTQLIRSGREKILSGKEPVSWTGYEVMPGQIGLINHGGCPKLLTKPGLYPGWPLRSWWARTWCGVKGLSDTVIDFRGLTVVQVAQNQAAVISDPQNQVFVIRNAGFVAFAIEGTYDVLAIVDQTHLPNTIKDRVTGAKLGQSHEVHMISNVHGEGRQSYVAATFLDIPANNCAILQRGDDLALLPAGQSVITNPRVTLRGLYTLGENQIEMPTKDIYTRDQVPVSLTIYLKWQLTEPLKLATHGYNTPYDALRDKTQSILTQIVAHLDYSAMIKQRTLGPDMQEDGSTAFLDALRTRAMDEMHDAAMEYGIVLKDLAVIDRQFKGEVAGTMDKLVTRALEAQVEAANVDRENSNKLKAEEGALAVARVAAQARNTAADAEAYAVIAVAKAHAEQIEIEAQAQASATKLAAEADAEAIRVKSEADARVRDEFARSMIYKRVEVEKVKAYGPKTVFAPSEAKSTELGNVMALGMAAGMGATSQASQS